MFLSLIFLGAQLHYCTDFAASPASTHLCPVCLTAGSVLVTAPLSFVHLLMVRPLEPLSLARPVSHVAPRPASPRAPPSL